MDGVALNEELMQADGIHPNAEAQPILLDNAWPVIKRGARALQIANDAFSLTDAAVPSSVSIGNALT